jgi:hypothetical protein
MSLLLLLLLLLGDLVLDHEDVSISPPLGDFGVDGRVDVRHLLVEGGDRLVRRRPRDDLGLEGLDGIAPVNALVGRPELHLTRRGSQATGNDGQVFSSASACPSQNDMSMSPYMDVAVARCSPACSRRFRR